MTDSYNYADNYYDFDEPEETLDLSAPCGGSCGGCSGDDENKEKKKECGGDCECGGNCAEPDPVDNNGREHCFWCGKKTKLVDGFTLQYDYCEECKK